MLSTMNTPPHGGLRLGNGDTVKGVPEEQGGPQPGPGVTGGRSVVLG